MDPGLKRIAPDELRALHRQLMGFHEHYATKLFAHLPSLARQFARAYYLGSIRLHFDIHERNHYGRQPWPMPCTAGQTTVVIDHDGHFRACELRAKLARLQDFDFDLGAALGSPQMREEIAAIPDAQCWCTHSCWIHTSAKFSPKVMLFHIPWAYMKSRWEKIAHMGAAEAEQFRVRDAPGEL